MAFSSIIKIQYKIKSISLPCRSHPSTDKIDLELNKLKSCDISSSCAHKTTSISNGLSQLEGLYKFLGDFLNLGTTQQALFQHHQCKIQIDDIQDKFLSLLDICGTSKDFMSQMKDDFRSIQSSLRRRRKGDQSNSDVIIAKYNSLRKKMKKDASKLLVAFEQIDYGFRFAPILELDQHVSSFIRVSWEVIAVTTSIIQSALLFICVPMSKQKTRWSIVSNLLHKGSITSEHQIEELNELQILDNSLDQLCKSDSGVSGDDHTIRVAQDRVKSLVIDIEGIENGVECLYRDMIKTRACILNICSSML